MLLLVLGHNRKAERAVDNFRADPRFAGADVTLVAPGVETPLPHRPDIRHVSGDPSKIPILEAAGADVATAVLVLAANAREARCDHESALIVTSLRRLNADVPVVVEMVDQSNREHLTYAGATTTVNERYTIANLLVRSVQDEGVSKLMCELLASEVGSEIYRVPVPADYVGRPFSALARASLAARRTVIGIAPRDGSGAVLSPDPERPLAADDAYFVVSRSPVLPSDVP
ncbi:MAG: NAD-binding protein [Myxococcota bacterium]